MIETMAKPDLAEHALGARGRVGPLQAPDEERHGDILRGAELGQQVMELEDEGERACARLRALCFAHLADRAALHEYLSGGGPIEAAQEMQERRLSRSGAPHDGDTLAAMDFEIAPEQHRHRLRSLVGFRQAMAAEHRLALIHSAVLRPD